MTPTTKLRFVEREIIETNWHGDYVAITKVRVLQQWWETDHHAVVDGEWRDVPLEVEK